MVADPFISQLDGICPSLEILDTNLRSEKKVTTIGNTKEAMQKKMASMKTKNLNSYMTQLQRPKKVKGTDKSRSLARPPPDSHIIVTTKSLSTVKLQPNGMPEELRGNQSCARDDSYLHYPDLDAYLI